MFLRPNTQFRRDKDVCEINIILFPKQIHRTVFLRLPMSMFSSKEAVIEFNRSLLEDFFHEIGIFAILRNETIEE